MLNISNLFFRLNRTSRLRVCKHGGFTGGLLETLADKSLETFSDKDFESVRNIFNKLRFNKNLQNSSDCGEYGICVEVLTEGHSEFKTIYRNRNFKPVPRCVNDLVKILNCD